MGGYPEPSWPPGRGPRWRDLTKPPKGSPSTCGTGAMHILALYPNLMPVRLVTLPKPTAE